MLLLSYNMKSYNLGLATYSSKALQIYAFSSIPQKKSSPIIIKM